MLSIWCYVKVLHDFGFFFNLILDVSGFDRGVESHAWPGFDMPEILPIGGGKGGVGKSFITASVGALIARQGYKVLLVDLDLGASNLHTFLGIRSPETGLGNFLNKGVPSLDDVVMPTLVTNLYFISSCNCSMEIANLFHAQKVKLISAIRKLAFDFVFIDLGAGTSFNTIDFFLTANKGMVICTPEPISLENNFRFIRAVYLRRLKNLIKRLDFDPTVKAAISNSGKKLFSSRELFNRVKVYNPEMLDDLKARIGGFEFIFLLNQLRKHSDADLGGKIQTVCNRHFYSPFVFLGNVYFDAHVHEAVYQNEMFVTRFPNTNTAMELMSIAELLSYHAMVDSG